MKIHAQTDLKNYQMPPTDVRMKGFSQRSTVEQAIAWIDSHTQPLNSEIISTLDATSRVLSESIESQHNVPAFRRAMMDGYAVYSNEVSGASGYNRLPLNVIGEVLPGQQFSGVPTSGTAIRIMTGAAVPDGFDAVLPVEQTVSENDEVFAVNSIAPEKNIGQIGEDIAVGDEVVTSGRVLRPQDLGVLNSIGVANVSVTRKPIVRIVVTGNELLPPGSPPQLNRTIDSNSPMLRALIERDGGTVLNPGIIADDAESIRDAMHDDCDVVLVSGGSSVGREDHAPNVLREAGELAIHGIAMRPSSPAGMGIIGDRLVFLLPGNPVSCLCAYDFFAGRAIRLLGGRDSRWPYRQVVMPLAKKLVSQIGRVDYARVNIVDRRVEPLAISGASMLSSTTNADGFVVVPADSEGYAAGANVEIWKYDS